MKTWTDILEESIRGKSETISKISHGIKKYRFRLISFFNDIQAIFFFFKEKKFYAFV
jgi:hypothetical protein